MPIYDGVISLYIRDLDAPNDRAAAEKLEEYKDILAQHGEISCPEWDFTLTHADSEPTE